MSLEKVLGVFESLGHLKMHSIYFACVNSHYGSLVCIIFIKGHLKKNIIIKCIFKGFPPT